MSAIALLILFCHQVFSQGIWKSYTTQDGLVDSSVHVIKVDGQGHLWMGTVRGVSLFDGENWTTYLDSVFVMDILIDNDGRKWFVGGCPPSGDCIIRFDGVTYTYYDPTSPWSHVYICLGIDSFNDIWVGTEDRYAYWFDGENWKSFYVWGTSIYDGILTMGLDGKGTLWFGHSNGVSTTERWMGLLHVNMYDIAFDKEGNAWCGSCCNGAYRYDGQIWKRYGIEDGLIDDCVTSVAIDSSENIWFGTYNGASRFDGQNWTSFTVQDGLIDNYVGDILVDPAGAIWFATSGGVTVYTDTTGTGVESDDEEDLEVPRKYALFQNYPNPFNSETRIAFDLAEPSHVRLVTHSILGQEVRVLVDGYMDGGYHTVLWDGKNEKGKPAPAGIYLYRLETDEFTKVKRMSLLK